MEADEAEESAASISDIEALLQDAEAVMADDSADIEDDDSGSVMSTSFLHRSSLELGRIKQNDTNHFS